MTFVTIDASDEDRFMVVVNIEKIGSDDEPVKRVVTKSISLWSLIDSVSNSSLSLGRVEINLDFDEEGELSQVEIHG